jgi:NADPH:quinone reductase-like Zn-dependent oxidoreductase
VTYGVLAGRTSPIDLGVLSGRGVHVLCTSGGSTPPEQGAAALAAAIREVVEGRVTVDYEELALEDGATAFARLAERSVVGKLILRP